MMLADPIEDTTKKLGDNLDVVDKIKTSLKELSAVGKTLLNDVGSFQDKLFTTVRKDLGLMGVGVEKFSVGLIKASEGVVKLGGNLTDVITYFAAVNKSLDRTTFLTQQAAINFRQLALVGVTDETIGKFNKFFDSIGVGIEDSTQKQKNLVNEARSYGLNVGEFLTSVNNRISSLTLFGFPKGVNDLSKMVAQSQTLGLELKSVESFAESIMGSPEKAFEIAAELQTIGGAFAQLGDGASLLYDAQNDLPGLQDKIVKAAASIATFNEESGQFEISAGERLRLRSVAGKLGMDVKELATLATKAAAQAKIFKELDLEPDFKNLSDEDKQLIANYTQFKGGKLTIEGSEKFNITDVLVDLKKGSKEFSDTSEKANENMGKTYQDSLSINQAINQAQLEFNSTMARSVLELDDFTRLTKDSAKTVSELSGKLGNFTDQIIGSATGILKLKNTEFNKGTVAAANPTSPGTSVLSNESNKALMSAKMIIEGKSQMDINIKSTLPDDFQKQIQGQLQTMLPSIIDARVKEILDNQGYSK